MSDPADEMFSLPTSGKEWDLQSARLLYALLHQDLRNLRKGVEDLQRTIKDDYTLKSDVKLPIRLVYGTAAVVLMAFMAAVVNLVMKGH